MSSELRLEDVVVHDKHKHHHGGSLPASAPLAIRFPRKEWELSGIGAAEMEVQGFLGFTHVRCPYSSAQPCPYCERYACHIDSLVVSVDGACPNNSGGAVTSALGVYFGDSHEKNLSWRIPDSSKFPHTNQRAELLAALTGLIQAEDFVNAGGQWNCDPDYCKTPCRVKHLVIKSDSAYLVNSITDYIGKWMVNGWLTANKTPVKNKDLWEQIVDLIARIKTRGADVDFWHVRREMNKEADRLANQALRS